MIKHQLSSQNWHLKIRLKPRHSSFFFLLARQDLLVPGLLFCRSTEHFSQRQGSDLVTRKVQKFKLVLMTDVWVWSCCRFDLFFLNYLLNSNHSWTPLIVYFWDNESSGTLNKFHGVRGAEVLTQTRSRDVTQDQILIWVEHHKMCRAGYDTGAGIMSGRSQGTVLVKTFHVESFFSFSLTVWMWWHCTA